MCPSPDVLEAYALGQGNTPELQAHVEACAACRVALARMQADNRFLLSFAVDGSLAPAATERSPRDIEIPGYQLLHPIQHGGQGIVWKALQRSTKRHVAIKLMKQGLFATLSDRARFDREIETLGRLNHPNIVAVHDAGVAAGYQYFVMDFVEGASLDAALPGWGSRVDEPCAAERDHASIMAPRSVAAPVRPLLTLFVKVCNAVHAAHLRGVIHRDLKPSNICVDGDGEPHVLDFGLAKSTLADHDQSITHTGQFVGSLPWAAPEQVEGDAARMDVRTDVYALGVMLFQLLTGELPIEVESNLRTTVERILRCEPQPPSSLVANRPIDDELDTIVLKCLSKDRDRRYQSAGDLARDLQRYLDGEPIEAKRDSAMYLMRKTLHRYRLRVAAAGAFVVLFAVFGIVMALLYRESNRLEQEATQSAVSLSQLLAQSNIEQGRMAGLLGNMEQAEHMLWNELLLRRTPRNGTAPSLNKPPGPKAAYWALWEMYRRFPCVWTTLLDTAVVRTMTLDDDGESTWTVDGTGNVLRLGVDAGMVDQYRVPAPPKAAVMTIDRSGVYVMRFTADSIMVWNRQAGDGPVFHAAAPEGTKFGAAVLSRDNRHVVALCDGAVLIWDIAAPELATRFVDENARLAAVALSNDGRQLAARDQLGRVHVWDIATGDRLHLLTGTPPAPENLHPTGALLFSPDDRLLADLWADIPGRVWDLTADAPRATMFAESPGDRRVAAFHPDGTQLAVGDLLGAIHVFDTRSGARRSVFIAHPERIWSVVFTERGDALITCGGNAVRRWELTADPASKVIHFKGDGLHAVAIPPDGSAAFTGGGKGILHRVDLATFSPTSQSFGIDGTLSGIAISPDGSRIAASTYTSAAYVWDSLDATTTPRKLAHPRFVGHLCFSPDGTLLATAGEDGNVRIWRVDDGQLLQTFPAGSRIPQLAFDPAGEHLAAAVRDGSLHVWDIATGEDAIWIPASGSPLRAVCYATDGNTLLVAGASRRVIVLNAHTRMQIGELEGHNQEIYALAIDSTGTMVASGDTGGTICMWNAASGKLLATLAGHSGAVMSLCFTGGGKTLVSVGLDCTLRIWDLCYYGRHIAGNLDAQLQRLGADQIDRDTATEWRDHMQRISNFAGEPRWPGG